jgi:hypothetical protein
MFGRLSAQSFGLLAQPSGHFGLAIPLQLVWWRTRGGVAADGEPGDKV